MGDPESDKVDVKSPNLRSGNVRENAKKGKKDELDETKKLKGIEGEVERQKSEEKKEKGGDTIGNVFVRGLSEAAKHFVLTSTNYHPLFPFISSVLLRGYYYSHLTNYIRHRYRENIRDDTIKNFLNFHQWSKKSKAKSEQAKVDFIMPPKVIVVPWYIDKNSPPRLEVEIEEEKQIDTIDAECEKYIEDTVHTFHPEFLSYNHAQNGQMTYELLYMIRHRPGKKRNIRDAALSYFLKKLRKKEGKEVPHKKGAAFSRDVEQKPSDEPVKMDAIRLGNGGKNEIEEDGDGDGEIENMRNNDGENGRMGIEERVVDEGITLERSRKRKANCPEGSPKNVFNREKKMKKEEKEENERERDDNMKRGQEGGENRENLPKATNQNARKGEGHKQLTLIQSIKWLRKANTSGKQ